MRLHKLSAMVLAALAATVGLFAESSMAVLSTGTGPWVEEAKLTTADVQKNGGFGHSVDISGETVIAGAWRVDQYAGAAYVFDRSDTGWNQVIKLVGSDTVSSDRFGFSVAVNGDRAVVGAAYNAHSGFDDAGAAYVFERLPAGWTETAKLTSSDPRYRQGFGLSVDLDGDRAIVGAEDDKAGTGAAYIFERSDTGWTETAKLTASDGHTNTLFGAEVAVHGDWVIVGSLLAKNEYGQAYIFHHSGGQWQEVAKLTAPDGKFQDRFGYSVAINDRWAVVGAAQRDENGMGDVGAAYVFENTGSGWIDAAKLTAADPNWGAYFGLSADLDGDRVVIGAGFDQDNVGAAYIFEHLDGAWTQQAKLVAADAVAGDQFAYSVRLDGERCVAGSWLDDLSQVDAGSAYVFVLVPEPSTLALLGMGAIGLFARAWRRRWKLPKLSPMLLVVAVVPFAVVAQAAPITIPTVAVGNPGNAGEGSGESYGGSGPDRICGAVDYNYNIGKYEVTAGQYKDFLNAVGGVDTYALYNTEMSRTDNGCRIARSGGGTVGNPYTYTVDANFANRPVTYVSWGDAARFANWLHNGQPTGAQDLSTTEDGAYYLNGATTNAGLLAVSRKADWKWALTSEDEWYKASYYKGGSTNAGYWDYPTGVDIPATPGNDMADASGNNANYYTGSGAYPIDSGKYTTLVGEFQNSDSPYGTFDQGGNVWEWNEAIPLHSSSRGLRGGGWYFYSISLAASSRDGSVYPAYENSFVGFRVASVPEPGSLVMLAGIALTALLYWWRKRV